MRSRPSASSSGTASPENVEDRKHRRPKSRGVGHPNTDERSRGIHGHIVPRDVRGHPITVELTRASANTKPIESTRLVEKQAIGLRVQRFVMSAQDLVCPGKNPLHHGITSVTEVRPRWFDILIGDDGRISLSAEPMVLPEYEIRKLSWEEGIAAFSVMARPHPVRPRRNRVRLIAQVGALTVAAEFGASKLTPALSIDRVASL